MVPTLFFYELALVILVWLFLMLYWLWPNNSAAGRRPLPRSQPSRRKRSRAPQPFAGLTQKPHCALCDHEATQPHAPSPTPPEPMAPTNRRPPYGQHLHAFLSACRLSVSRLARTG
jgi:hypothetical protein